MTGELRTGLADETVGWYSSTSIGANQALADAPAWEGLAARKSRRHRGPMVMAGIAAGILVAVFLVIGLAQSSPARRLAAGTRQLTFNQLQPGDCLTGSDLGLGTGSAWPYLVTAVPCNQRHLAEIIFAGDLWPASLTTFPGVNAVTNVVDDRCKSALYTYAGESQPWLTYDSIAPGGSSDWASGDRLVVCMAYEPGVPLRHSVKATHR